MNTGTGGKRVCMLIESFHPIIGGMESQARALVDALVKRGFDVHVLTRLTRTDMLKHESFPGGTIRRIGPAGKTSRLRWAFLFTCLPHLIMQRNQYDLIFVPGLRVLGMAGVLISRILRKPCVLKADSEGEMSGSFFKAGLEKVNVNPASRLTSCFISLRNRLLLRADYFVSLHSDMTREFLAAGVSLDRIQEIPNMVDTETFYPVSPEETIRLRKELDLPETGILALFVGRIVSYKGVPNLVRACRELFPKHNLFLVIPGTGGLDMYNCEDEIKRFRTENKLEARIIMPGLVKDISAYMKACDILTFPTENDALPLTLIEAMACGLPVITTPVGGIKDLVQDRVNGLLVEPGNERQLMEAIEEMIAHETLQESLSKAALETVDHKYTAERVGASYADLFNRLIDSTSRG